LAVLIETPVINSWLLDIYGAYACLDSPLGQISITCDQTPSLGIPKVRMASHVFKDFIFNGGS
jgi:hypothetical protein